MPDEFDLDYLVKKVGGSPSEQDYVWNNWTYPQAVLQMMFGRYENYVDEQQIEQMKNGD